MSPLAASLCLIGSLALPTGGAQAQEVVPKLQAMCPLGYVDTFNGKCSPLGVITYTVAPTRGEACDSGWVNIGGGYCRRQ
ncbi:hypothetical protein KQ302_10620 [Synechococcus sp. CS-602]|nr:hypothetical protein [Synechococcus sp. CS-603]MCT0205548.1 hypothetical protein [Synechococcus sp. CS-602]MCT0246915.1 hypothetical protein [Synechococcus sp. CS-601]